jgi:hypothetical protein
MIQNARNFSATVYHSEGEIPKQDIQNILRSYNIG